MPAVRRRPRPTVTRHYHQAWAWGAIRITCDNPKTDVSVVLGEGVPEVTGGFGGWEIVERPRQVSMTQWKGVEPFQLAVNVIFEGYLPTAVLWGQPEGIGMEGDIYELMRVARGDDETPPGICRIYGIQLPAERWVIEDISFDADGAIVRSSDRRRLRQKATLTFREYVPASYLRVSKSALQGSRPATKVITTKKGDTPAKVAHRAHCKWTDIRTLNPKVMPLHGHKAVVPKANLLLKVGQKLRVPIAQTKPVKKRARAHSAGAKHATKRGR